MGKQVLTFRVRGGLGNQLFQATAANFFANKLNALALIDDYGIIRHHDWTRRSWIRYIDLAKFFGTDKVRMTSKSVTYLRSKFENRQEKKVFNETELQILNELDQEVLVRDWFQSGKYLPSNRPNLEKSLKNVSKFHKKSQIKVSEAAIHIRLGDFKGTEWGILPARYYLDAMIYLHEMGIREIDCYSDDIPGAKSVLNPIESKFDIRFPEIGKTMNPITLLCHLSSYENFISSNSSLSWWACYLNSRPNCLVISQWEESLRINDWHNL